MIYFSTHTLHSNTEGAVSKFLLVRDLGETNCIALFVFEFGNKPVGRITVIDFLVDTAQNHSVDSTRQNAARVLGLIIEDLSFNINGAEVCLERHINSKCFTYKNITYNIL